MAAAQLFSERGYAATDLRLIAKAVGLHVSSFYNYIQSKEELLYLVCRRGADEHRLALEAAVEGESDPVKRLRSAIQTHVLVNARMRHVAWSSLNDMRMLTGEYLADMRNRTADYEAIWRELIQEGIAAGALKDADVDVTVYAILTMLQGVSRWFSPDGRMTAAAIADLYADWLIEGLMSGTSGLGGNATANDAGEVPHVARHA